ncbi:hypothetical protein N7532_007360 [Penicillium argentinense]|uniref:Uncharacterized protein n=1 Tax=Penicillium argentinense TaxID=1131581 RepID=A0A9W9K6N5_9EURO|nr:uncharacterized protein N7532_007360 [Penicillium argentinense]KAJ5095069.1 hypothetical protein N7532_007360 [Penicillium argentinense]
MRFTTAFSFGLLGSVAAAVPGKSVASTRNIKRGGGWNPEDQSGNAQVYFSCDTHTYPNPGGANGQGEGGTGISTSSLEVHLPDGTVLTPGDGDCQQDSDEGVASYLQVCTLNNPALEAGHIIIHAFYEDIAGECSMNFSYRGQDYSVNNQDGDPTSSCGWSDGGFEAFGSSLTDVCYFNVGDNAPSSSASAGPTPTSTPYSGTPTPLRRRRVV